VSVAAVPAPAGQVAVYRRGEVEGVADAPLVVAVVCYAPGVGGAVSALVDDGSGRLVPVGSHPAVVDRGYRLAHVTLERRS